MGKCMPQRSVSSCDSRFEIAIQCYHTGGRGLARENYLPPPRRPNFGRSCEGYGRYDLLVFSRIWVSTVVLATQSSILLSGGGGR